MQNISAMIKPDPPLLYDLIVECSVLKLELDPLAETYFILERKEEKSVNFLYFAVIFYDVLFVIFEKCVK